MAPTWLVALFAAGSEVRLPSGAPCNLHNIAGGITCGERLHWLAARHDNASAILAHTFAAECGACDGTGVHSSRTCIRAELNEVSPGTTCGDLIASKQMDAGTSIEERLPLARAAVAQQWPVVCACDNVADSCDTLADGKTCRAREYWVRAPLTRVPLEVGVGSRLLNPVIDLPRVAADHTAEPDAL